MGVRSRNHVTVSGRAGGPVVMPAHGFGCGRRMWRLAVPLPEHDVLAPSPCFIGDPATGYRGGFSAEDIDELLESPDANHLGRSGALAPVIMGNPERPERGEELTNSFCRTDPDIARVTDFVRAVR